MSIVQLSKFWALSRDSYIILSYLFLCVKCFFSSFFQFSDPASRSLYPGSARARHLHLMFCSDTYQRNVLYHIICAYKCQLLFSTFLSFYHHSLYNHTNCRPKLYGLLVRRIFENKHRKTKQPFMILNPKSQSLPKKRSNLSGVPVFLYLPNLQQFLF